MTAEIQQGLQYLFQTDSKYVLLVSGSGHSGMEAVIANLLEPGETIVVSNHGIWGERVIDMAERYGGAHLTRGWLWRLRQWLCGHRLARCEQVNVADSNCHDHVSTAKTVDLKAELGKTLTLEQLTEAVKTHKPAMLFVCQVRVFSLCCCSYLSQGVDMPCMLSAH